MDTLIPMRCMPCGKTLGHLQIPYENLLQQGYSAGQAMDILRLKRYCCRKSVFAPAQLPLGGPGLDSQSYQPPPMSVGIPDDLLTVQLTPVPISTGERIYETGSRPQNRYMTERIFHSTPLTDPEVQRLTQQFINSGYHPNEAEVRARGIVINNRVKQAVAELVQQINPATDFPYTEAEALDSIRATRFTQAGRWIPN